MNEHKVFRVCTQEKCSRQIISTNKKNKIINQNNWWQFMKPSVQCTHFALVQVPYVTITECYSEQCQVTVKKRHIILSSAPLLACVYFYCEQYSRREDTMCRVTTIPPTWKKSWNLMLVGEKSGKLWKIREIPVCLWCASAVAIATNNNLSTVK